MRVTDKEIEKALGQLSQAMGNDKSTQEYEKLWDKARYDGKPQYIDGVVMSGHIFEKSITEMRKMEVNAGFFFKNIQEKTADRDELLKEFNKVSGVNFKDEKEVLKLYEQVNNVRIATETLSQTMNGLDHRPQVIQPQFNPKILSKEEVKAERIPPGMDLVKQETMKKYQFIPPCEMRGGRVVLHLNASDLKDGNNKDNRPVELVMTNKQFVSMVNCAMKKEEQTPSFPKNMTKEYVAAMSRIYPKATEQEHLQRYQTIRDAMNKGAQSLVQESSVQRVQPNRNRGNGMER